MARLLRSTGLGLALVLALAAGRARAANEGQPDLDKATQLKISATTTSDLSDVIKLCERALQKGLDKNNSTFANNLMAAALTQRGSTYAAKTFHSMLTDGNWQKERKEALADLERAVTLNSKQPQAHFMIARLCLSPGGDAKRAVEALNLTIEQADDEPQLRAEALVLRASTRKDTKERMADLDEAVRVAPNDAAVLRARGASKADANQLPAALTDFDRAIELEPKNPAGYQLKAMVLVKQKKNADALAVLQKAERVVPDNLDLPLTKARIHTLQSDYKAALDELNRAIVLDPSNLTVLLLRAAIYQEMGQKDKALIDIDKVLTLQPSMPVAMRDRAVLLADLGKFNEAVTQLEQLRRANPKDALTLLQLGMLYTAVKQYEKSAEAFSAVLAEHAEEWSAYRGRGDAYLSLGRRADAVRDYDHGLRLRPKDVGILNNLAWVLATAPEPEVRDGKRAVLLANEACKLTEFKQDYILSTLAAAYAETGDFPNALKWSDKAIELGSKQHIEDLKKESVSYKAGKPWREALPLPEEKKK